MKSTPAPKKRKGCLLVAGVSVALMLVVVLGGAWYLDGTYGILSAAPAISHAEVAPFPPVIFAAVDPSRASGVVASFVNSVLNREVPPWLLEMVVPHGASIFFATDYDSGQIDIHSLLNERRLGPLLVSNLGLLDVPSMLPKITWGPAGIVLERRGVITLAGSVPMEDEAREAVWYSWPQHFERSPLQLTGGHAIEVVADNRGGGAYLVVASLLDAFEYELNEDEQKISLSSLKFVIQARLYIDVLEPDSATILFSLEIAPEAVERIGVVNLKAGIDELFNQWSESLENRHKIELLGESGWKENVIEWNYTLERVSEVVRLGTAGEL